MMSLNTIKRVMAWNTAKTSGKLKGWWYVMGEIGQCEISRLPARSDKRHPPNVYKVNKTRQHPTVAQHVLWNTVSFLCVLCSSSDTFPVEYILNIILNYVWSFGQELSFEVFRGEKVGSGRERRDVWRRGGFLHRAAPHHRPQHRISFYRLSVQIRQARVIQLIRSH